MNTEKTLIIIPTYGNINKNRSEIELSGIHQYLNSIFSSIIALFDSGYEISGIIFSGGYTDPKLGISEAEDFKRYFIENFDQKKLLKTGENNNQIPILCENSALNHSEKIAFSLMTARLIEFNSIYCYCDQNFEIKVNTILHGLLGKNDLGWVLIPVKRGDIHPSNTAQIQTMEKMPAEIFSPRFKTLQDFINQLPNIS